MRIYYSKIAPDCMIAEEQQKFDKHIFIPKEKNQAELILDFFKNHKSDEIIVRNIYDFELQLIQMTTIFSYVLDNNLRLEIEEKPGDLTTLEYVKIIVEMGQAERQYVVDRTLEGINKAKSIGKRGGRPSIKEDVVEKIIFLAEYKKMNYRTIANECGVSIGTVNKYTHAYREKKYKEMSMEKLKTEM